MVLITVSLWLVGLSWLMLALPRPRYLVRVNRFNMYIVLEDYIILGIFKGRLLVLLRWS